MRNPSEAPGLRERRVGRGVKPERDCQPSAFTHILDDLVARVPGAIAAGFVDSEGESVDYAGWMTPFDIKVACAHWRIIINQIADLKWIGAPHTLVVRGAQRSTVVRKLHDGYAVVLVLGRRAGFAMPERAFSACEVAIAIEVGWPIANQSARWFPVMVEIDARRRPARIVYGGLAESVEVLGRLVDPNPNARDQAFRVRLASGPEITVVREQGGFWYAEEPV